MSYVLTSKRLLHTCYDLLISPHSKHPDTSRQEFILNILLTGSLILVVWSDAYIFYISTIDGLRSQGISFLAFSSILILFVCLLILSRKGYCRTASYGLLAFYFLGTTYGAYQWGPDLQPVILSYVLIIFISGILISGFMSFVVTSIISVTIVFLAYLQIIDVISPLTYWKQNIVSLTDMLQFVVMFFIITTISWLSNREHEQSLRRAHESERLLKEERDALEAIVERRTE